MNNATAEQLIAFEHRIRDIFAEGEFPFLIHLGGGNESELIKIFDRIKENDWILASHRSHLHALLAGMPADELEQKIRAGDSMFTYSRKLNFITSAILGGCCGIASGIALAIREANGPERVHCFIGDGGSDNGHLYEAAMFVEARNLPCYFIIEDNDRSVDTTKSERLGPRWKDPFKDFLHVHRYRYKPTYPHGGAGLTSMVTFKQEAIQRYLEAHP
jgi:TPP-dependent pyruvate/acetoin dehydrogenase alpha subunit